MKHCTALKACWTLSLLITALPDAGAYTTSQVAKTRKDGLARGDANWTTLFGQTAVHLRAPLRIDKARFPCSAIVVTPSISVPELHEGKLLRISFIYHKEKDGMMTTADPFLRVQTLNSKGFRIYTVFLNSPGWVFTDQPGDFRHCEFDSRHLDGNSRRESFGGVTKIAILAVSNHSAIKPYEVKPANFKCLKVRFVDILPSKTELTVEDGGDDELLNLSNRGFVIGKPSY
jgi:hypothetical protein